MIGDAGWALLGALAVLLELAGRRRPAHLATSGRFGAFVASRLMGRVLLLALWSLAGLHLFARATPR